MQNCQQSKAEIRRLQAASRRNRTSFIRDEQGRVLKETTARLEEREKMVSDLSEVNHMNRLLITRYQEHEDMMMIHDILYMMYEILCTIHDTLCTIYNT